MSTETQTTPKVEPTIWHAKTDYRPNRDGDHWEFRKTYASDDDIPAWDTFTINSMGFYREDPHPEPSTYDSVKNVRYLAGHRDGKWYPIRAFAYRYSQQIIIHLYDTDELGVDRIAFPIDPRVKEIDVTGACHIYENEKNTGWLFAHATPEDHHERLLLTEAVITTVFEELLSERLNHFLVGLHRDIASNQRLGRLAIYEHIRLFKGDCAKIARYNEHQLYIGQHVHEPEKYDIYSMCQKALKDTKKKWTAEKPAELNQISRHLTSIETRLTTRPKHKRRWEIPTVFPNAQAPTEAEGENS